MENERLRKIADRLEELQWQHSTPDSDQKFVEGWRAALFEARISILQEAIAIERELDAWAEVEQARELARMEANGICETEGR